MFGQRLITRLREGFALLLELLDDAPGLTENEQASQVEAFNVCTDLACPVDCGMAGWDGFSPADESWLRGWGVAL